MGHDKALSKSYLGRTNGLVHKNLNIAVKKITLDPVSSIHEETLKDLINEDDRNNPMFSSINVIYEENNNLDIS